MKNIGEPQFDYDSFKQSYDSDESIQQLVKQFDKHGISLNSKQSSPDLTNDQNASTNQSTKSVSALKNLKDRHKISS